MRSVRGERPALRSGVEKAVPAVDLAALAGQLREAGVPVVDGRPVDGETRVYVDGPFGNRIELVERSDTLLGPP